MLDHFFGSSTLCQVQTSTNYEQVSLSRKVLFPCLLTELLKAAPLCSVFHHILEYTFSSMRLTKCTQILTNCCSGTPTTQLVSICSSHVCISFADVFQKVVRQVDGSCVDRYTCRFICRNVTGVHRSDIFLASSLIRKCTCITLDLHWYP